MNCKYSCPVNVASELYRAFSSRDPKSPLRHVGVQLVYNDCTREHEIGNVTCRLLLESSQRKPRLDTRGKSE